VAVTTVKIIKHQYPDFIEEDYFETEGEINEIRKSSGKIPCADSDIDAAFNDSVHIGYIGTRVNYDMLEYLPEDMETVIGQNELMNDFGKGAFSLVIVEDMPAKDVAALKEKISKVEHVDTVIWYDSIADLSIPMEMLPNKLYSAFNTENATLMQYSSILQPLPMSQWMQ